MFKNSYQIDFLDIGDKESGDCIILQWNNIFNNKIAVIDTGYSNDGKKIKDFINKYHNTNKIDLVIITHADADHIGGLKYILEEMEVEELWIHKPWEYNNDLKSLFLDGRITNHSISERLKIFLENAYEAVKIANKKNIKIYEPFKGLSFDDTIFILGPTTDFYKNLIPEFLNEKPNILSAVLEAFKDTIPITSTLFKDEILNDNVTTSAKNNSSVICYFNIDNRTSLFTGDAGIKALNQIIDDPIILSFLNSTLTMMQIPHHGSKNNIGPSILNKLLGEPQNNNKEIVAIASCAKNSSKKHPHPAVTNAFKRRGAKIFTTQGLTHCHSYNNSSNRQGWNKAKDVEFIEQYFIKS